MPLPAVARCVLSHSVPRLEAWPADVAVVSVLCREHSPSTTVIIDHWGFFMQQGVRVVFARRSWASCSLHHTSRVSRCRVYTLPLFLVCFGVLLY